MQSATGTIVVIPYFSNRVPVKVGKTQNAIMVAVERNESIVALIPKSS